MRPVRLPGPMAAWVVAEGRKPRKRHDAACQRRNGRPNHAFPGEEKLTPREKPLRLSPLRTTQTPLKDMDGHEIHEIDHFFNPSTGAGLSALTISPSKQTTFYLSTSNANQEYPKLTENNMCELHYVVQSKEGRNSDMAKFNCWR